MRRLIGICFLVSWFISNAVAGAPKASVISTAGPEVLAGYPVLLDATTSVCDPDQPLSWQVVRPIGPVIWTFDKGGRDAIAGLLVTEPGKDQVYTVAVSACSVDSETHHVLFDTAVVEIHAVAGPAPPNPPVPPNPPTPGKLARVIMVYESAANLTRAQYNILSSTVIRAKLNEVCPKDGWRCWDEDVDVSREGAAWQSAWASVLGELAARSAEPTLILFDDRGGHVLLPLPTTVDDFLNILGKYAR